MLAALSNPRTLAAAVAAAGALLGSAGLWLMRSFELDQLGMLVPPCMFYVATDLYCAGCGITRALHALAHGDAARAVAMNPLVVFALVAVPLMLADLAGWRPRVLAPLMRVLNSAAFWLVLLPGFWIARNLPWAPFTWLAPG